MTGRVALSLALLSVFPPGASPAPVEPESLAVEVLARYPHDTEAWTQGLVWNGLTLFESTGLTGHSSLRECVLATGAVVRSQEVAAPVFAEGLTQSGSQLIQLTWQNRFAIVYDAASFDFLGTHSYTGEGWGLCNDGTRLIMSDGTSMLQFRDPVTFAPESSVEVTVRGTPQGMLNELEFVGGHVFSNVWMEDRILEIDPVTGITVAEIDASGLLTPEEAQAADVLNGIAYRPEVQHFLLTGKLWPWVFEVEFVPVPQGLLLGHGEGDAVTLVGAGGSR